MTRKSAIKPLPTLLSVQAFATEVCMSVPTVRLWISRGTVASCKLGKGEKCRVRIPSTEVARVITDTLRPATKSFRGTGRPRKAA
jgi:hypothetical protein